MEVEYVSHGLGNRFDDCIELNKDLLKYPELHKKILRHELAHTNKNFSGQDLRNDFLSQKVGSFEILKFMIMHPKSFSQFLPIYHTKKHGWVYDLNLIIFYAVIVIIVLAVIFFATKF